MAAAPPPALRGYGPLIVESTGCPPEDAREVEEFMRLEYGTLDHLDRLRFAREARISFEALKLARSEPWYTGTLGLS
jgi:hypothetical protein